MRLLFQKIKLFALRAKVAAFTLAEALTVFVVTSILVAMVFQFYRYLEVRSSQLRQKASELNEYYYAKQFLEFAFANSQSITVDGDFIQFNQANQTIETQVTDSELIAYFPNKTDSISFAQVSIESMQFNEMDLVEEVYFSVWLNDGSQFPLHFEKEYAQDENWAYYRENFIDE